MKQIKELVIDRARWGVGESGGHLQDGDTGLRCCLGFLALQCGAKVQDIRNRAFPVKGTVPVGFDGVGLEGIQAARVNDEVGVSPKLREARIKEIFAKRNIKVKFIGRIPKPKAA